MVESNHSGHITICELVLESNNYQHIANRLLYQQDNSGKTPLHLACQKGNIHFCELFLKHMEKDTYLFIEDLKRSTPLHTCAKFGDRVLIEILLPKTIDKNIAIKALNDTQDIYGKTPLHLACAEGRSHTYSS